MEKIAREQILAALANVRLPGRSQDIVSAGLISDVVIANSRVMFAITADAASTGAMEPVRREAERVVAALPGVEKVMVALTAERKQAPPKTANLKSGIPGLRHIVAVASGKGGVGKSTMAAAIAYGLKSYGASVGLMDADVYGPSNPHLVGASGRPMAKGERIQPIEANGLKLMSIGFMIEPERAVIMRGPMLHGIVQQFLHQVEWGALDYLVIDLPPGTGDVPLTLSQSLPLTGAVVVCTPQQVALLDAEAVVDIVGCGRNRRRPAGSLVLNLRFQAFDAHHPPLIATPHKLPLCTRMGRI